MTETQSTTADPPPPPSETHSYTIVTPSHTPATPPIAIEQVSETRQRQRERHARPPAAHHHAQHRTRSLAGERQSSTGAPSKL
jgi:hypothetical protein